MNAELTTTELETIAKIVSKQLHAKFIADESQKELSEACEKYTKQIAEFYISEFTIPHEAAKIIGPVLNQYLKESKIIDNHLQEYLSTEDFKKKTLEQLKYQVRKLEKEIYELEEE